MKNVYALLCLAVLVVGCGGGSSSTGDSTLPTVRLTTSSTATTSAKQGPLRLVVPPATFPDGSIIELKNVTVVENPITNAATIIGPMIELRSPTTSVNTMTVELTDNSDFSNRYLGLAYRYAGGEEWDLSDFERQGDRYVAGIPAPPSGRASRLPITTTLTFTVVSFPIVNDASDSFAIIRISGTGRLGDPNTALLIHGINSTWESVVELGEDLVTSGSYRATFAMRYDWRLATTDAAEWLGTELDRHKERGKYIDIIAHSRGGLVARWALERLGKTDAVKNAIFVCVPHTGSKLANAQDLLRYLKRDYINQPGSEQGFFAGFPMLDSPALSDLQTDSWLTRELNTARHQQAGKVNYFLVSGNLDLLVGDRAVSREVPFEALTEGVVDRYSGPHNHSSLLRREAGRKELIERIFAFKYGRTSGLNMFAEEQTVQADDYGWSWTLHIRNESSRPVTVKDLRLVSYDKNGDWIGTHWYTPTIPPNTPFPKNHISWNRRLGSWAAVKLDITYQRPAIHRLEDRPGNFRAQTRLVIARVEEEGQLKIQETRLDLISAWGTPSPAKTRSVPDGGGSSSDVAR